MTGITLVIVVIVVAVVVGMAVRRREGRVRATAGRVSNSARIEMLTAAGVQTGAPTILHFSASWCGPCAAVRRIVQTVIDDAAVADGPSPREVEVDMDDNPRLAREMGVMSLPTTFVLGADLAERSRAAGVPSVKDLKSAVAAAQRPAH